MLSFPVASNTSNALEYSYQRWKSPLFRLKRVHFLHRKISRYVCCFPDFPVTVAYARFDLRCHVRLLNQ